MRRSPAQVDPRYDLLLRFVVDMLHDRTITRVDQVAQGFAVTPRSLQRLFHEYIGAGPKWLIRRFRLHDSADRLARDRDVDLARMAAELGWSDQAHFARDFKALVGQPPSAYAEACAATAGELVTRW